LSDEIVLQKAGDPLIDDRILAFLKEICKGLIYTNNQGLITSQKLASRLFTRRRRATHPQPFEEKSMLSHLEL
jgi:hypothetical protein